MIEVCVYGNVQKTMMVVANESRAFVHDKIRRSGCVIVVDHEFIVVHSSSRNHFRENLTPGQRPPTEAITRSAHRVVPRRWLSQRWIVQNQFHSFPNDDLV